MNLCFKNLAAVALSFGLSTVIAAPSQLITHNNTSEQSNAYIAGSIPSPYPAAPHDIRKIPWNMVRLACYGHTVNDKCAALVKMATNTSHPVDLGTMAMDLKTGDITPKVLSANGYTLKVIGAGEVVITRP